MTSRVLALLAALASPVFLIAACVGWLEGFWPANPLTLCVSALVVCGGPLLGLVHVATAGEGREAEAVTQVLPVPVRPRNRVARAPEPPLAPELAAARAFHRWRDTPPPGLGRS